MTTTTLGAAGRTARSTPEPAAPAPEVTSERLAPALAPTVYCPPATVEQCVAAEVRRGSE